MMKRREFLGSVVGGSLALAGLGRAAEADSAREGVFIDCQAWWQPAGQGPGHIHIAADMPLRQALDGEEHMVLQLEAFNQPRGTKWKTLQVDIDGLETQNVAPSAHWPWACATAPGGVASREVQIQFSTLYAPEENRFSGWTELKLTGIVQRFDGRMLLRTRIPVYLENDYPVRSRAPLAFSGSTGWFFESTTGTNHGYPTAKLYQQSEQEALAGVPASWSPVVGVVSNLTPLSHMRVCVDPAFHAGNAGTVIYDDVPLTKTPVGPIETSTLTPGWHRLFVEAREASFSAGSASGVVVYRFWVP
jgi:hypothetical protein